MNTRTPHGTHTRIALALCAALGLGALTPAEAAERIALVVKNLGNGYFEAANKGGQEAAREIGGVELVMTGPTQPTAEGQIEIINSLIAQKFDAIIVMANDPNALVPVTKKAMQRGIKVISADSAIAPEGRILHLSPSNAQLVGEKLIAMIGKTIGGSGEIAVLSATAQATNQNAWIEWMKKTLAKPEYATLKLDAVVYGDDQSDKSYREANGLLATYPNLKGIIAPTTVGITAASRAVVDKGLIGKVFVSGLGLPSEMAGHVKSGAVDAFALWNPIDVGYSATWIAHRLVKGEASGKPGEEIDAGRMGRIKVGDKGDAAMAEPFTFDKANIDEFARIF